MGAGHLPSPGAISSAANGQEGRDGRKRRGGRGGAHKKMGPALLPTPLSPMRGPVETGAWHPAVSRSRTEARGQVRRRRSHRHPETPSCHLVRPLRGEPLRRPGGKTLDRHFRNRTFLGGRRLELRLRFGSGILRSASAGIRPVDPARDETTYACPSSIAERCRQESLHSTISGQAWTGFSTSFRLGFVE